MNERRRLSGPRVPGDDAILTPAALAFLDDLVLMFGGRVSELLARRAQVQERFDAGERPDFLPETEKIRRTHWKVARLPPDLENRTVEITGPVERKMIINALNSGAQVFMADFEDSLAPTWTNVMAGQVNLCDAVRKTIEFVNPKTGKLYKLGESTATLMVRPRGWHLEEAHITLDGKPVPAALVDFGFFFFHNAQTLVENGSGPYFYLPKLQSHHEARLWNEIFVFAQKKLGIPNGSIKATVLIETLPAAFEMDEILYELRDHSAGLNCGRWDYIFSYCKTLRNDANCVIPDRAQVGMTQPNMTAYTSLLIRICHRRGAFAMGGMAAQIPIKGDAQANEVALAKVKDDKEREARAGHDGTWVAHPGLVKLAQDVFSHVLDGKSNQLDCQRLDVSVSRDDLLQVPTGTCTMGGLEENIRVGIQYLESWLGGSGCVPLYNLMEDAATAEISRTQIWQWLKHGVSLEGGTKVSKTLVQQTIDAQMNQIRSELGDARFEGGRFQEARDVFSNLCTNTDGFIEFATLSCYPLLRN